MTHLRILATASPSEVFNVCEAINDLGGLAVAPRKVELVRLPKQRRPQIVESPFLGAYFFASLSANDWHATKSDYRTVQEIGPTEWRHVQAFCARVEQDYQLRMGQYEAGRRLEEYNPGDALQLLGGLFADHLATFQRLDESGPVPMIKATVQGVELLGRPVEVTVDPINAKRWAAE